MTEPEGIEGPDFADGVAVAAVPDGGMLQGKLGSEEIILARRGFGVLRGRCPLYTLQWPTHQRDHGR